MNTNKVLYQVAKVVEDYPLLNPWRVAYTHVVGGDSVTAIAIESPIVEEYFIHKYGDWYCPDMWAKFIMYNTTHAKDLITAQYAYNEQYNPLSNYGENREKINVNDDGDEERTHVTGGEGGTHNKVTNEALDGTYTQHDTTTYDNATFRGETKDTQHGGTRTTDDLHTKDTTHHTTIEKTINGDTYAGYEVKHEKETKDGYNNSPQDNIKKEIELRLNPIECIYLDQFIKQYGYYINGAWGCMYDD